MYICIQSFSQHKEPSSPFGLQNVTSPYLSLPCAVLLKLYSTVASSWNQTNWEERDATNHSFFKHSRTSEYMYYKEKKKQLWAINLVANRPNFTLKVDFVNNYSFLRQKRLVWMNPHLWEKRSPHIFPFLDLFIIATGAQEMPLAFLYL